jgi:hypothetical protein
MSDDGEKQQEVKRESRDEKGRFLSGVSGNPNGRPKGSRHALEEDFVATLQDEFRKRGAVAVAALESKELCDIVAKVLPKEARMELGENFADLLRQASDVLANRGK